MSNYYFLYKIDQNCDAQIYGKFTSLSAAKMSASLLLISDICFILSGDMSKIYFYDDKNGWDYDVMTPKGKLEFLEIYPNPNSYK